MLLARLQQFEAAGQSVGEGGCALHGVLRERPDRLHTRVTVGAAGQRDLPQHVQSLAAHQGGVEVDEVEYSSGATRRGLTPSGVIEQAKLSFEDALNKAQPVAEVLIDQLRRLEPDEATVEFGLTLSAEVGAILATASSTANYKVTLTWRKPTSASGG